MKDTLYTQTLARAAQAEGGTAVLAGVLRVPERTLGRWMSGRAQMPLRAFLKALERLTVHEASGAATPRPPMNGEPLAFRMGNVLARCARCEGAEFVPTDPKAPVKLTAALLCRACGDRVIHGNLIAQLAQDTVQHSHAMSAARGKRQAARQAAKKPASVRAD